MRLLAIGDVHGCFSALTTLWDMVRPSERDRVVFLGDYIDRGMHSREVVDWMVRESARPGRVFLRGNHEDMMLDAAQNPFQVESWIGCGGLETLASYEAEGDPKWKSRIPKSHWSFLGQTLGYFETAKHIFVHGCLDPKLDLDQQPDELLFWETFNQLKPHKSGKKVVCGHTFQVSGEILDVGYGVCIDTGAAYGGWLSCLDVDSGELWQANESGQTRPRPNSVLPARRRRSQLS